jgi:DNA-binding MarR family transcriptional regulator
MPTDASTAAEFRVVLGQLMRRLRADQAVPLPQISVLGRLARSGSQTVSALAAAEGIRPQSMSQTVAELEAQALVSRHPDPLDGRRIRVDLTDRGREILDAEAARRDDWLTRTIDTVLTHEEQAQLEAAIPLLRRLASGGR